MAKKKRKCVLTKRKVIGLLIILCVAGSRGYKQIKYEYHAKSNASRYIFEKYGFEPELSRYHKKHRYISDSNDFIIFNAKYKDKEFVVVSDCSKGSSTGVDNYQYEELKSDITEEILSEYPDGKIINYQVAQKYDIFPIFGFPGFSKFYKDSNIDEVLTDCLGDIKMVFYDTSFSDIDIAQKFSKWDIDFDFISLDSKEHMNEFIIDYKNGDYKSVYFPDKLYEMYAPYITDYIKMGGGKISHEPDIKEDE